MSHTLDNSAKEETAAAADRHAASTGHWEQRWHPLREEWVIIAAHRNQRPWTGDTVNQLAVERLPPHAADCYLCPGNVRVHGTRNPVYDGIFVFENDLPCVSPAAPVN